MSALIPTVFPPGIILGGRYEVIRQLGSGGQGVVYEVLDHYQSQRSALKLLNRAVPGGVWREAELLTQLQGPFLLAVRNADLISGVPFVTTEVATSGTAQDQLALGVGVATESAVRWVLDASRGLARMHDHRLVHNDIKPENIFLDATGGALLGDLGLAAELDSGGRAELTGGTPVFMAPEVAAAALGGLTASVSTIASDVYGLGATAYCLLAGHPPFPAGTPAAVFAQIVADPPESLAEVAPHVPLGVRAVVARAMNNDPALRFASAADFDYALARQARPARRWSRMVPHAGHFQCFEGIRGTSALNICVEPGPGTGYSIYARHVRSGRSAGATVTASGREMARKLRGLFRAHM